MNRMLAALAAALALLAAAVSSSLAKGPPSSAADVREAAASVQASGSDSTATATATCPPGTKAIGGGFDAPPSAGAIPLVYESVKAGEHAWRASMQLFSPRGNGELTLTTYAYCRARAPATHAASDTVPTTGEVQLGPTASATCPHDWTAVAGGFHMPPPLAPPTVTALFFDSLRSGDSAWDDRVVTGPAGPSTLTSEAYCAVNQELPGEAGGESAPNDTDGTVSTASAGCPAGTTALAGGFAQPQSSLVSFFFVTSSRRVGDGWQVSGLHSGFDPAVPLDVAAYCG
jgi:hypothetical protein